MSIPIRLSVVHLTCPFISDPRRLLSDVHATVPSRRYLKARHHRFRSPRRRQDPAQQPRSRPPSTSHNSFQHSVVSHVFICLHSPLRPKPFSASIPLSVPSSVRHSLPATLWKSNPPNSKNPEPSLEQLYSKSTTSADRLSSHSPHNLRSKCVLRRIWRGCSRSDQVSLCVQGIFTYVWR